MNTYKLMEENERDKLESRLSNHIDRATSQREAKWVSDVKLYMCVPNWIAWNLIESNFKN